MEGQLRIIRLQECVQGRHGVDFKNNILHQRNRRLGSNGRKHKVPLWKSSALVLLACQHDKDEGLIRGTTESVVEIEKKAKDSKVRLE